MEHERVGFCHYCKREIFCHAGFLNGVKLDGETILCFSCYEISTSRKAP